MRNKNRELSGDERRLIRWMLLHADSEAAKFLPQLDIAQVTPWKCPCGCASLHFQLLGKPEAPPGIRPLAEFIFGDQETLSSIFVYENQGILSGLEVYGFDCESPKILPPPEALRPFSNAK